MQREIIFRGKRIDNGEWAYGDLIHTPENKTRIIWFEPMYSDGIDFYNDFNYLVNKETIGQFTGLTDKNGVKIFEGDRLRDDWIDDEMIVEDYVTVVWDLENGQWAVDNSFKKDGSSYTNLVEYVGKSNLEIIGNIHDHAKL